MGTFVNKSESWSCLIMPTLLTRMRSGRLF